MTDFIVETRPSRLQTALKCPDGFVAELRPSSRRRNVHLEKPDKRTLYSDFSPDMASDPSGEMINNDYETDLNNLLQKKRLSIDRITDVLHNSVVTLVNTLLKGYSVESIEGSININLAESQEMLSVNLNEYYTKLTQNDQFSNTIIDDKIRFKDTLKTRNPIPLSPNELNMPCQGDLNEVTESCPFYGDLKRAETEMFEEKSNYYYSPRSDSGFESENFRRESLSPSVRRMSECSDKSENDEESGYASSERDSVSSPPRESNMDYHEVSLDVGVDESPSDLASNKNPERLNIEDSTTNQQNEILPALRDENIKNPKESLSLDEGSVIEYDEYIDFDERKGCNNHVVKNDNRNDVTKKNGGRKDHDSYSDVARIVPMNIPDNCKDPEDAKTTSDEEKIGRSLSCKNCPATFHNTDDYRKHTLECYQVHSCPTCLKDFSSKNNLKRHLRIHTGSRPYKCGQCDMSFARKDDLKGHTLTHDFSKPFRCSICKKGYTDRACVKNHMSKEHCSRLMKICPQCGESFDREDAFLEHKKTHPSLKQFSCDTCPFIGTNHLMAMKHKLCHSHKLFSCKSCNAYFADPFDYTKHVRKHKKNKEYSSYVCCFCDTVLPTYEQFVRHEYSHAQGKFHECMVCKKQFKSKILMLEHALVHSNRNTPSNQQANAKSTESVSTDTSMDCVEEKNFELSAVQTPTPLDTVMKNLTKPNNNENGHVKDNNFPPTLPIETSKVENQFEGELLDLSMKPPKAVSYSSPGEQRTVVDQTKQKTVTDISSPMTSSLSPCVPRNGYTVIDAQVTGQEASPHGTCFGHGQTDSKSKDEGFQIVWQSPTFPLMNDKYKTAPAVLSLQNLKQKLPIKSCKSPTTNVDVKNVNRANDIRYKPYDTKRDEMVNLVSKFMAARGNIPNKNPLKDIENTSSGQLLKNNRLSSLTKSVLQVDNQHIIPPHLTVPRLTDEERANLNVMIGLTGKPCLELVEKSSSNIKQECADDHPHQHRRHFSTSSGTPKEAIHCFNAVYQNRPPSLPERSAERNKSNSPVTKSMTALNNNIESNKSHDTSHHRHECETCKMKFESFSLLEDHCVAEHNRYPCEFCGKGFTARPNRDRHVRYHTGERPYKCELCPSSFFRGDDLKYHRTTRHPMEQISCNRCSATFTWQKDLDRHLRHSKCVPTV